MVFFLLLLLVISTNSVKAFPARTCGVLKSEIFDNYFYPMLYVQRFNIHVKFLIVCFLTLFENGRTSSSSSSSNSSSSSGNSIIICSKAVVVMVVVPVVFCCYFCVYCFVVVFCLGLYFVPFSGLAYELFHHQTNSCSGREPVTQQQHCKLNTTDNTRSRSLNFECVTASQEPL